MFETQTVGQLFPTHLWIHQLKKEDHEPLNRSLITALDQRLGDEPIPRGKSIQTANDFHRLEEAKPLLPFIEAAVDGALDYMEIRHEGVVITSCWANIAAAGASHSPHCHPNNYLAGVYYVHVPEGGERIMFDDPRPFTRHVAPDVKEHRTHNSASVTVTVATGTLLIFPAWLIHYVPFNRSDERRISVAFNIMFSSFAETISQTKWQGSLSLVAPIAAEAKGSP